ncbi:phage tail tape measure protein, partial [bacterium]|nr:phage tail tape measure protein [bacterium]
MASGNQKELSLILKAYDNGLTAGLKAARTELGNLNKGSNTAATGLTTLNTNTTKTTAGFKSLSSSASGAVNNMVRLAAAYGAFRGATAAVSVVTDFNTAMAEVSTLTDASEASLAGLSNEIINISTQLPQTAGELATATYDIISAGVSLGDTTKVLELSAKAAIAGVTDTQTAVNAGVGVMNAYGQEVDSLDEIYDTLFQTVKLGVIKFEDLAENIGKVTPIARSAEVNFTSLSAAIATLTKAGLKADIATTGLRGAITALSTPTPEAKKAMEELGISWTTLEDTIKQIADQNLGAEVMRQIIPDVRARTAVLSLSANYETLETTLGEMNQAAGATEAAFEKMIATFENKFKLLKSTVIASILKNKEFAESLNMIADSSSGAAEGIGTLTSNLLTFSANIATGYGALAAYHDAFWNLNEVTLSLNAAQTTWEERLSAVNTATGLNITSSKEMFELIKLGVIEYDKQSGAVKVNAVNLGLYNDGLLEAGASGLDFVKIGEQIFDELELTAAQYNKLVAETDAFAASFASTAAIVADELGLTIGQYGHLVAETNEFAASFTTLATAVTTLSEAQKTALQELIDESIISLAKLTAAGKAETEEFIAIQEAMNVAQKQLLDDRNQASSESYAVQLADLKLALAETKITQEEFNQQMLVLNQKHWTDEVEILTDSLAETKAKLDAGEIEYSEYEAAILKLRDAQTNLADATAASNEKWDTAAKRLGLTEDQLLEVKYRLGELERPAEDAGDALVEVGNKGKEAGTKAGSTAGWGADQWQSLADEIGVTV